MKILGSLNGFHRIVASLAMAAMLAFGAQGAVAQDAAEATATEQLEQIDPAEAADVADPDAVAAGSGAYTPMKPTEGKGMPVAGGIDVQQQFSPIGHQANALHIGLVWVMVLISLFVLALFVWVILKYNKRANPVPSKTSHNTLIEVIWTVIPVPILVGTLGKALGTQGAFVAGSDALIEALIQFARPYIYTTSLSPALAWSTLTSLDIVRDEPERRNHLFALVERFRNGAEGLSAFGLHLMASRTPIQPLVIGSTREGGDNAVAALKLAAELEAAGIWCTAIRPPTVPAGTARLRITLSAAHDIADVDRLLEALHDCARRLGSAQESPT